MLSIAFCICLPEGNHQSWSRYVTVCHGRILQIRFWIVTKAITWSRAEKMAYKLRFKSSKQSSICGFIRLIDQKNTSVWFVSCFIMFHHGSSIFPNKPPVNMAGTYTVLVRIFQRAKVLVEALSFDLDEALSLAWLASQLALGNRVIC